MDCGRERFCGAVEVVEYADMRFRAYEDGCWSGDLRGGVFVFSGGNVERLEFGAGLRASLGEDVGEGDADSPAVMVLNREGARAFSCLM